MIKILIVDDAAFMRQSLRSLLEKNGYKVIGEAENGKVGITKYKKLKPDIVMMDVAMPILDGINALRLIKEYDPCSKVIMMSSMSHESLKINARTLGCYDFIPKPLEEKNILDVLLKL